MSDGIECKECAATTAPDYGYELENWNDLPDIIKTTCVSFSGNGISKSLKNRCASILCDTNCIIIELSYSEKAVIRNSANVSFS